MKFTTALVLLVSCIALTAAHGGLLFPPPRGGIQDRAQYNGRFHAFIGFKDNNKKKTELKFPCGGFEKRGPVTRMRAGQRIDVRFYASDMNAAELKKQPQYKEGVNKFKQARHGGGLCEFSLSYDGGRSFHLIGRYTKTCPDSYHPWPVRIPSNVQSCTHSKCLFVWSWTANILPQYYMNCADIHLTGVKGGVKPKGDILVVDFKGKYKNKDVPRGVRAVGDGVKHTAGEGPSKNEIAANLRSDKSGLPSREKALIRN